MPRRIYSMIHLSTVDYMPQSGTKNFASAECLDEFSFQMLEILIVIIPTTDAYKKALPFIGSVLYKLTYKYKVKQ